MCMKRNNMYEILVLFYVLLDNILNMNKTAEKIAPTFMNIWVL